MKLISKINVFLIAVLLSAPALHAQELRCNVQINSDKIEGTNKSVFNTLQQSITDYMNNIRWTNLTYTEQERIECNMLIIVNSVTDGEFNCEMQVQANRPVYSTNYMSPLLNIKDNYFSFTYSEYDRLEYQEAVFNTNLTAMLAYYCYLIIGFDLDSYSRLGGTPCFQQCENIVTAAQTSSLEANSQQMQGWKGFGNNKNRYTLTHNLMDEAFKPFREFYYNYHRLALDQMAQNVTNARAAIAEEIHVLQDVQRSRPTTTLIATFLDAKADELVNIFQKATPKEKQTVYDLLMAIDPTRQSTYDRINE